MRKEKGESCDYVSAKAKLALILPNVSNFMSVANNFVRGEGIMKAVTSTNSVTAFYFSSINKRLVTIDSH
jgi:hypothetical protein